MTEKQEVNLKQRRVWEHPKFYVLLVWTQLALVLYMLLIVTALGAHWTDLWQDLPRAGMFWWMETLILLGVTLHVADKCRQENRDAHKKHHQQHPEQLLQLLLGQAVDGKLISDQLQALHLDFPALKTSYGTENERWALYCRDKQGQVLLFWVETSDKKPPQATQVESPPIRKVKSLFLKANPDLHAQLFGTPEHW